MRLTESQPDVVTTDERLDRLERAQTQVLSGQAEILAGQSRILEVLERGRGARDRADLLLVQAIVESAIGHRFTAGQCFRHARVAPDLDAALKGADVDSTVQLGLLLKRMTGATIDDMQLECIGETREGRVYRVRRLQE